MFGVMVVVSTVSKPIKSEKRSKVIGLFLMLGDVCLFILKKVVQSNLHSGNVKGVIR